MSIKVHLYSNLPDQADHHSAVEVRGNTVGECLDDLIRQFPGLQSELFDNGKLRPYIFISINLKSPRPEQLERSISQTDELYIIRIVAGG